MSTQETTVVTSSVQTDANFVKTPNGIIRIVEMVLCIIAFIMAAALGTGYVTSALGFIQFATICGFLQALVYFLINLFMPNIPNYKPHGTLIEFILSVVWTLFLLIAGIIAAVYARHALIGAIAAFSFFGAIAYGVGSFFLFKDWRSGGGSLPTVTTTSSTTTTTVQT